MAISFVGANVLSGAAAAIPTYLAGDDIYVAAWRSGDWLSDPSGYTVVVGATANNYYATMWRKTAASGSSWDVVTVTGASYIGVWVVRGSSGVGASAVNVNSHDLPRVDVAAGRWRRPGSWGWASAGPSSQRLRRG
jgi:hypothetical protein